jgi:outer membrane protein OmpA-like peptidoglycan-associated protein
MKVSSGTTIRNRRLSIVCLFLLVATTFAAAAEKGPSSHGQKATVKGTIISREGNLIKLMDMKNHSIDLVKISNTTKIGRRKDLQAFFRHTDTSVTALVPGLTVKAEGVGNAEGELEANQIKFCLDLFAVTVAQGQQIFDNKAAVGRAQTTADQGVANAVTAQPSADQAQSTANQGVATAEAARVAAAANTVAAQAVDKRVSDLGGYVTVDETGVYFAEGSYKLNDTGKAALGRLISANSNIDGYVIEIAGYTSSTGSAEYNQRLSEERVAVVAQYLNENAGVPMWRLVVPAGFGETHAAANNSDTKERALNRRVEVKIRVNIGVQEGSLQGGYSPMPVIGPQASSTTRRFQRLYSTQRVGAAFIRVAS